MTQTSTEILIAKLKTYAANGMPDEDILEEAANGYGGNADDAYELGYTQGQAKLAEEIIEYIEQGEP